MAKEGHFRSVKLSHSGGRRVDQYCIQSGLAKPLLFEVGVHLKGTFIPSWRNYGSRRLISTLATHLCSISRRKKMSPIASSASTTAPIGLRVVRVVWVGQSGARRLRAEHGSKKPSAVS